MDLTVIREMEDEPDDVHDSTTLLDPSEGEPPTTNNVVSELTYNASMSSQRNFDHHSEYDLYVHWISFGYLELILYLPIFSQPIPRETQESFATCFHPTNYSMFMAVHRVSNADGVYHTD